MSRFFLRHICWWGMIFLVALWIGIGIFLWKDHVVQEREELPEALPLVEIQGASLTLDSVTKEEPLQEVEKEENLPSSINLAVPFTSQAPKANWDLPYQEACEEAAMLMVDWYNKGVENVSIETADQAILDFIAFEEAHGFSQDLTAKEVAQVIEDYFGYPQVEVLDDPTVEIFKTHLAAGRPVLVPSAGRLLGNPHFRSPGPIYHMLVLRGYTEDQFITNDSGTRYGEAYLYPFDTVINAMHDWNDGEVETGAKRAIIIYP